MPDESEKSWKQRWMPWIVWVISVIVSGLVGGLTGQQIVPPPPPQIVEVPVDRVVVADPPAAQFGQGWVNDPEQVQAILGTLPIKSFGATPAGQQQDLPAAVYLWKAYEKLPIRGPPVKNQGQVGSCVSFGTNTAVERTLAAEILAGQRFDWTRFVEEATYGGSRVEIGGGRIRGDGSVGAWAAKFVTQYGCVPRKQYPQQDLTSYSENLCRSWGRSGVPDWAEGVCREFPVKDTTLVRSWDEAKRALANGYAIAVCSNQGFANRRDANGVARPSGSWAHCMALDGYHVEGSREYGHIVNSWGTDWISGPTGWGNPGEDGFWAESDVVERMLRQGDSWAFSGVVGFPKKRPDWFIRAEPRFNPFARNAEFALSW